MLKTHRLGHTNIDLSRIGLGAMPLSLQGRPDESQAFAVINAFLEQGGNFIDTANVYCMDDTDVGHNERLIAKSLEQRKIDSPVYVATKGGLRRPKGDWTVDASPEWLRQSCEKSLKDLNTETLFLYQLHSPDPDVPLTDSVGELSRLREEGKIQHIGLSNVNVEHIQLALSISHIISVQNRCNLFDQKSLSNGVVDYCAEHNISFIAHSPVGGHFLHANRAQDKNLVKLAEKYECSPYQIMLAWLLHKNDCVIPIPGASKVSSITDSLKTLNVALTREDMQILDSLPC